MKIPQDAITQQLMSLFGNLFGGSIGGGFGGAPQNDVNEFLWRWFHADRLLCRWCGAHLLVSRQSVGERGPEPPGLMEPALSSAMRTSSPQLVQRSLAVALAVMLTMRVGYMATLATGYSFKQFFELCVARRGAAWRRQLPAQQQQRVASDGVC